MAKENFFRVELAVVDKAESEVVDFLLKHSCLIEKHWKQFGTVCSTIIVITNDLCRLDALCVLFNGNRKLFQELYIAKYHRILCPKQTYKHFYTAHNEVDECDIYLEKLNKRIKTEGSFVLAKKKRDNFLLDEYSCYKKRLGAVKIKDNKGNIVGVNVAYEDFNGEIKYYFYPKCEHFLYINA